VPKQIANCWWSQNPNKKEVIEDEPIGFLEQDMFRSE
jgi:hypothetical protein